MAPDNKPLQAKITRIVQCRRHYRKNILISVVIREMWEAYTPTYKCIHQTHLFLPCLLLVLLQFSCIYNYVQVERGHIMYRYMCIH